MRHIGITKKLLCVIAFVFLAVSLLGKISILPDMRKVKADDGWTEIPVSADTRTIYVSSSMGNDSNDGLSESTPVKTLAKAVSLMRDGYPDHMLLKRGDVWVNEYLDKFLNGRSATEPIVVSYYGDSGPRPLIKISSHFINHDGQKRDYQWFIGLHIKSYKADPADPEYTSAARCNALRFVGGGKNLLIEDCKLEFTELIVQGWPITDAFNPLPNENIYQDVKIRRNIITDVYAHGSTRAKIIATGMYVDNTDGLLIEENFLDHNGWNENIPDAMCNMFNHNMYIQFGNIGSKIVIRGNIMARAAAHGVQARAGGLVEDNLAVNNALGFLIANDQQPLGLGHTTFAICRNNVALEGRAMLPDWNYPRSSAVHGIGFNFRLDVPDSPITVEGNIAAHRLTEGTSIGIDKNENITYRNNIQYNWGGGIGDTPDPGWLDPNRTVGSYHGTLGKTPTLEAFLEVARNRGPGEWLPEYTAYAVNAYIREGFTVTGTAPTPTAEPTAAVQPTPTAKPAVTTKPTASITPTPAAEPTTEPNPTIMPTPVPSATAVSSPASVSEKVQVVATPTPESTAAITPSEANGPTTAADFENAADTSAESGIPEAGKTKVLIYVLPAAVCIAAGYVLYRKRKK